LCDCIRVPNLSREVLCNLGHSKFELPNANCFAIAAGLKCTDAASLLNWPRM
jgi:hypothetical protein